MVITWSLGAVHCASEPRSAIASGWGRCGSLGPRRRGCAGFARSHGNWVKVWFGAVRGRLSSALHQAVPSCDSCGVKGRGRCAPLCLCASLFISFSLCLLYLIVRSFCLAEYEFVQGLGLNGVFVRFFCWLFFFVAKKRLWLLSVGITSSGWPARAGRCGHSAATTWYIERCERQTELVRRGRSVSLILVGASPRRKIWQKNRALARAPCIHWPPPPRYDYSRVTSRGRSR